MNKETQELVCIRSALLTAHQMSPSSFSNEQFSRLNNITAFVNSVLTDSERNHILWKDENRKRSIIGMIRSNKVPIRQSQNVEDKLKEAENIIRHANKSTKINEIVDRVLSTNRNNVLSVSEEKEVFSHK